MNDNSLSKASDMIRQIDAIYQTSPTAQTLVANAPVILAHFKEMALSQQAFKAQLDALAVNRQYDLDRFRLVADRLLGQVEAISAEILSLQAHVRSLAARYGGDPNARTVIEYTNSQINQHIQLYNSLVFSLLNS